MARFGPHIKTPGRHPLLTGDPGVGKKNGGGTPFFFFRLTSIQIAPDLMKSPFPPLSRRIYCITSIACWTASRLSKSAIYGQIQTNPPRPQGEFWQDHLPHHRRGPLLQHRPLESRLLSRNLQDDPMIPFILVLSVSRSEAHSGNFRHGTLQPEDCIRYHMRPEALTKRNTMSPHHLKLAGSKGASLDPHALEAVHQVTFGASPENPPPRSSSRPSPMPCSDQKRTVTP